MRTLSEIDAHYSRIQMSGDFAELEQLAVELEAMDEPAARALQHVIRGTVAARRRDMNAALVEYEQALQAYTALQNIEGMARAQLNLGRVQSFVGEFEAAEALYQQAIEGYTQSGKLGYALRARVNIGLMHETLGHFDTALKILSACVAEATELQEDHALGNALFGIGGIYMKLEDYGASTEYYRRAIDVHERLGEASGVASSLNSLASIQYYVGNYTEAAETWYRALDMVDQGRERVLESTILSNLANLHLSMGEQEDALRLYEQARDIAREIRAYLTTLHAEGKVGQMYIRLGRFDEGAEILERVSAIFRERGDLDSWASHTIFLAGNSLNAGRIEKATALLQELERTDINASIQADVLRARAEVALIEHDTAGAREHLLQALSISEALHHRPLVAALHQQLRDLCKDLNDFEGYVQHNEAWSQLHAELHSTKVGQQLATQQADRRVAAERLEREREREVLYSTLPRAVADRVIRGEPVQDHYDLAAVLFLDVVGFTTLSGDLHASTLAAILGAAFGQCDAACARHEVTKVKTIGDSYLAFVASTPERLATPGELAARVAGAAMEILQAAASIDLASFGVPADVLRTIPHLQVRIGLHLGPLFAGVIGTERLQYDIWGDTVNVASRLEHTSEPGRIHVSEAFANALALFDLESGGSEGATVRCRCIKRGSIDIKGKGEMTTYWLDLQG